MTLEIDYTSVLEDSGAVDDLETDTAKIMKRWPITLWKGEVSYDTKGALRADRQERP